jgi:XapX domain-containing protein
MIKMIIALVIGFLIGAACRWFDIPVPAPPQLLGVFLIMSITVGYLLTDKFIAARAAARSAMRGADRIELSTKEHNSN